MEDVAKGLFRVVFKVFHWLLIDALVEGICYFLGRFTLLVITLGRYPRGRMVREHEGRITLFGVVLFFLLLFVIAT